MKRLYKSKDNPFYNKMVDNYMLQSDIFNDGGMNFGARSIIMTKDNMKGLLIELEGFKNGNFLREDKLERASIPFIKDKIAKIEDKFIDYQKSQQNEGYEKPTQMPQKMLEEFYTLQARLTVLEAEADELRKRLQVYKDRQQKEKDDQFLAYGLRGIAHFWGFDAPDKSMINVLKEIDDQKITQLQDGLLIINDTRSSYSGMLVSDYYKLVKTFYEQQRTKEQEKLKRVQEQARTEGRTIPLHLGAHGLTKVSKESLPKWPNWAKNYLAKENTIKRTR